MRIARVLTRLNLGGPARQALAADPVLRARGHEVRLFTGRPQAGEGDLFDEFRARGLDVVRIGSLKRSIAPVGDFVARRALRRALDDFAPELLHTHASKAGMLGRQVVDRLPKASSIGRVHTFHGHVLEGYFPLFLSRRLQRLEARLAQRTDRIVAVSHRTAEDLVRLAVAPTEQIVVVPPGIELEPFLRIRRPGYGGAIRDLVGAGPDDVLVGVVGRLAEVKQPWRAIDLFAMLGERFPHLHIAFIGDGVERPRLERAIAGQGAEGERRLHLLGNYTDMGPVLHDLDLVLATSRSEGMPVALIEAAAAALPVVATDVGGVSEVVAHGRTGMLGTTDEELADALVALLEDPRERRAMGQRGRMRVEQRHCAAALANRLEAVYHAVLADRTGGEKA